MRTNKKYLLNAVSDYEWLNEIPYEMVAVYCSLDQWGSKEIMSIPQKFSDDELNELMIKYPEWWTINNKEDE